MDTDQSPQVRQAIAALKSFRDGESGIDRAVACGRQAVPALRQVLFEREPSGLYQARCRAIDALAALRAHEVLIEFLAADRTIADPIERVGEDAAINAAALALAKTRDERVFALLLRLASRACLTGVIGALGAYRSAAAIPALIDALEEDASRLTAEGALKKLGKRARAALLRTASRRLPSDEQESESSARRRRSALRLLAEIGIPRRDWEPLRPLLQDPDPKAAMLACRICFARGTAADWRVAARSLIDLLGHEDWTLRENAETCLIENFAKARQAIDAFLCTCRPRGDGGSERTASTLRRLITRTQAVADAG